MPERRKVRDNGRQALRNPAVPGPVRRRDVRGDRSRRHAMITRRRNDQMSSGESVKIDARGKECSAWSNSVFDCVTDSSLRRPPPEGNGALFGSSRLPAMRRPPARRTAQTVARPRAAVLARAAFANVVAPRPLTGAPAPPVLWRLRTDPGLWRARRPGDRHKFHRAPLRGAVAAEISWLLSRSLPFRTCAKPGSWTQAFSAASRRPRRVGALGGSRRRRAVEMRGCQFTSSCVYRRRQNG